MKEFQKKKIFKTIQIYVELFMIRICIVTNFPQTNISFSILSGEIWFKF